MKAPKTMSTAQRRKDEREATREKILLAGRELLLSGGIEGFSMRKLAALVGLTATAIYFHFPDKTALLGELVEREFMVFRKTFDQAALILDPVERLARMGKAYCEFALSHPDAYQFLFMTPQVDQLPKVGLIERGNPAQDCYAYLRATVQEAIAAGRFKPCCGDADQLAQVYFSAVHGVVAMHLTRGRDPWVDWRPVRDTAALVIDGLIAGLTLPAAQPAGGDQP